jgi:hypothetical protein
VSRMTRQLCADHGGKHANAAALNVIDRCVSANGGMMKGDDACM